MARASRAGLPEALFWDLTPCEADSIMLEALDEWRAKQRGAAYNAAMICSVLCNINRDTKKRPQPFTPDDFLPQPEQEPPSPEEVAEKAKFSMAMLQKFKP